MTARPLSDAALAALACATVTDRTVVLPGQLDPGTYREVDQALRAIGGKWNRRAAAHTFTTDPRPGLEATLAVGRRLQSAQQATAWWPTPPDLAGRVARLAREAAGPLGRGEGMVLDPSAGEGALLDAVRRLAPDASLAGIEPDPARVEVLTGKGYPVLGDRFETFSESDFRALRFDGIIMNPPYSLPGDPNAWATHLELALTLLAGHGRLVAVLPRSVVDRAGARFEGLRELVQRRGWVDDLPDGTFREAGTSVRTSLVVVDAPALGGAWA